jgi:molecular chaperone DnaJ
MPKRDFYEVLGVSKNASAEELKKAYRKAALAHHPDKAKGETDKKAAETKFKEVSEAYEVLKDPQKKAAYDSYGHAAFENGGGQRSQGNPFGGGGGAQGNPFGGGSGFGGAEFNTDDIFDMFFGGNRGRNTAQQATGHDLHYAINISFDQAVHGGQERVQLGHQVTCATCNGSGAAKDSKPITCDRCQGAGQINQTSQSIFGQFSNAVVCPKCEGRGKIISNPCPRCHGKGRLQQTDELVINIPAGADNGTEMRFTGRGDAGLQGAPAGDLYIEFHVQPHPYFRRRNHDIFLDLPLTFTQATLGGTIQVPTIDGPTKVKIPAGITTGTEIHLASKGVPKLSTKGRGSQFLIARIDVPRKISPEERKALEQLQKVEAKPKLPW